jgi:hypothetical protein
VFKVLKDFKAFKVLLDLHLLDLQAYQGFKALKVPPAQLAHQDFKV